MTKNSCVVHTYMLQRTMNKMKPWPVRLTISRQTLNVNMKSMQALLLKQALFTKHPI